jgi:hypothetical protein
MHVRTVYFCGEIACSFVTTANSPPLPIEQESWSWGPQRLAVHYCTRILLPSGVEQCTRWFAAMQAPLQFLLGCVSVLVSCGPFESMLRLSQIDCLLRCLIRSDQAAKSCVQVS